jgi:hypothetical protein
MWLKLLQEAYSIVESNRKLKGLKQGKYWLTTDPDIGAFNIEVPIWGMEFQDHREASTILIIKKLLEIKEGKAGALRRLEWGGRDFQETPYALRLLISDMKYKVTGDMAKVISSGAIDKMGAEKLAFGMGWIRVSLGDYIGSRNAVQMTMDDWQGKLGRCRKLLVNDKSYLLDLLSNDFSRSMTYTEATLEQIDEALSSGEILMLGKPEIN